MFCFDAFLVFVGTGVLNYPGGALASVALAMFAAASLYTGRARRRVGLHRSLRVSYLSEALVLLPIDRWSTITKKGLTVALQLRGQIRVVHVDAHALADEVEEMWMHNVVAPLKSAGQRIPEFIILKPPVSYALSPMAAYVLQVEREEPDRQIVVIVPELAVRYWWQKPLHNYRNRFLKWVLYTRGSQRIMIIDVPWFL